MSNSLETTEQATETEPVTELDDGLIPQEVLPDECRAALHMASDLLTAHLCLTAPDRNGLLLPTAGWDLQDNSVKIYRGLKPHNAMESMLATLAVGVFNSSLSALADGSRRDIPITIRDINMQLGIRGAKIAAELLEKLKGMQDGSDKRVNVGAVNVAAGGQAIVGNIKSGPPSRKPKGASRKSKRSARNS